MSLLTSLRYSFCCRDKLGDIHNSSHIRSPSIPATTLPLRAYSVSDVSQLMHDLCTPCCDIDALRRAGIDGIALPSLDKHQLDVHLCLSRAAQRNVQLVQRADRLFTAIARRGRQSRLSELDLRVWLMGTGVSAAVVNRLADRFRCMSYAGDGMLSFAELVANFAWFDAELKCAGAYM